MQLMQVPKEIHLSIIKSILESVNSVNALKPLAFTCRHFAYLCLYEIWKTRRFVENNSLKTFRNTLSKNLLIPYGDFILSIQLDELNKLPPIYIDDKLIKFLAEKCKNLKELILRFSQKKRKNKAYLLPLELLGDRINNLSIADYENWDNQMEMSSLVTIGQQAFNNMYNNTYKPSTCKDSDNSQEGSKGGSNDSNRNDEAEYQDALSKTVKLGVVKSVRLYDPKMSERVWESFTSNAKNSLQSIRITLNQSRLTTDPSTIVMLFGKYCKNLRIFDIDTFQQAISKDSIMILLENCKKLEDLDIAASSEAVPFLYKSKSIKSIFLSRIINGNDLNQINECMENLKRLSFLKIDGKSNLLFLKNFPNLECLSIEDFGEMNDEGSLNVSKLNLTELDLFRTPNISDEALLMFGSMNSLVKFKIRAGLPNVTQKGWINLVRRPIGCPSWRSIRIDDGRQINPEFFEILEQDHSDLEFLRIRGFKYDNLLNDDSFEKSKFKEAWWFYKNTTSYTPIVYWPIRYKKENYADI
ncbi:7527_t:CDS:2 [Funneliformis geosporum]|uniref:3593_t:CDS:1 n=1 Tax=Funneliformis geosporum TaxID=1117311 RepID=A0A9W4SD28_9GLOM|nr:3593_t:CDS:2 [Funneliformis geosporum]CAI2162918.1 7527_t:CDS:2 [Funneliformis geosporum]